MPQRWTRRGMLSLTAAGVVGTQLPMSRGMATGAVRGRRSPAKKFGGYSVGLQSYSLRAFSMEEALKRIVDLGLHWVEPFSAHFAIDPAPENVLPMLKQARRMDIAFSAHGVNGFTKDHEKNRRIFDFANAAGIKNLSADPDPDSFDSLDRLVEEYGIRIAIHNHGPGHRYGKIDQVHQAVKDHHPRIGACCDLGHFIRSAEDPVASIKILGPRVFGLHLKDFAEPKGDAKGVILGDGHLDLIAVFKALREVQFPDDGAISIEYEENPSDPMPDLRVCVTRTAEAAERSLG